MSSDMKGQGQDDELAFGDVCSGLKRKYCVVYICSRNCSRLQKSDSFVNDTQHDQDCDSDKRVETYSFP